MLDAITADRPWTQAATLLLATAADDLQAGATPAPTLAAYRGEEPIAVATLRPFATGELPQVLLEVLALLLPLGTDRIALSAVARAWPLDDAMMPATGEDDVRPRVLLVVLADAHDGPCHTHAELHPFEHDAEGWSFGPPIDTDGDQPTGVVQQAVASLLDGRGELLAGADDRAIAAQLARVLLLGHQVALAPDAAAQLERCASR